MGGRASKTHPQLEPEPKTDKTVKPTKTTQESLQDALDAMEKGLYQPAIQEKLLNPQ